MMESNTMSERAVAEPITPERLIDSVKELAPGFRERAAEGEAARELPSSSSAELLSAQIARVLVPSRWGGLEFGLDTWLDLVLEISKADASHGWCAGILTHTPHIIACFPEEAQAAVWAETSNVAMAGSIMPVCKVEPVSGGYRVSGRSPFASGVGHSTWGWIAGMIHDDDGGHTWTLFVVPSSQYEIVDTWDTAGMRATGSNTIVTENIFVPEGHAIALSDLINGTAPGGELHDNPMYRLPFMSFGPIGFVAPMLGAALGAFADFRTWAQSRTTVTGAALSEMPNVQVRMARADADLDIAELLLRRAVEATQGSERPSLELRARCLRDCARASELITGAVDVLMALSGTSGFAVSNPLQRAWRDIHFASCHISLNPEMNFAHWGRMQLGLERPATVALY
jgi:3-hydroxy-9,10-secoandrosta-1,3,5(10)-triene-9,17-dione monooxygenase